MLPKGVALPGCKVENYSFCEKRNAFYLLMVFCWRNSPSVSEAGGLLGSAIQLLHPSGPPLQATAVWGDLSPPKQPAVRCLWSALPSALTRSPLSSQAHSNLGDFNLCLSTGRHMGLSPNTNHGGTCLFWLPTLPAWCSQETQEKEASTPLAFSAGIRVSLPWPPCSPTSPLVPLHFLTLTQPLD